jgi:hypothetical protein
MKKKKLEIFWRFKRKSRFDQYMKAYEEAIMKPAKNMHLGL